MPEMVCTRCSYEVSNHHINNRYKFPSECPQCGSTLENP